MAAKVSKSDALMVTRPSLARVLGVSLRQVGSLEASGHIVPTVRGKAGRASQYDLTKIVPTYLAQLTGVDKENPRDRKDLASAELTELRIAKERGELIESATVEQEFSDIAVRVKARLRAVPDTVSDQVVALADQGPHAVRAFLLERIDEALLQLSLDLDSSPAEDDDA